MMQNWLFITVNQDKQLGVEGVVLREITPESYLCKFHMGEATHNRIVSIEELSGWVMFQNPAEKSSYLAAQRKIAEAAEADRIAQEEESKKPAAKKPAAKKPAAKKPAVKAPDAEEPAANNAKEDDDFLG